jgi:hypothetical protein
MTSDYVHPADGHDSNDNTSDPRPATRSRPWRDLLLALAQHTTPKGWRQDYGDSLSAGYQLFIGLEDKASLIAVWHLFIPRRAFRIQSNFHADECFVPSSSRGSREAYGSGPMNDAYFKISLA